MISDGIDISKDKSMICFMKPGGEILEKPYEIAHNRESINELIEKIKEQEDEVRVIMEHTGLYHYPLLNSLLDAHIFVSPINGCRMKRYCSQNIRKVKNDHIDSTKIASYGLTYWNELECFLQPNEIYRELRALSRQYYTFTAMKAKAKVNVDLLITKTMPGIKGILQDNKCNHRLTDFVLQHVHYDNIWEMNAVSYSAGTETYKKIETYERCQSFGLVLCYTSPYIVFFSNSHFYPTKILIVSPIYAALYDFQFSSALRFPFLSIEKLPFMSTMELYYSTCLPFGENVNEQLFF